jgi:peptidoglycan biosynthesis protein MviN/MurJ (putative lipid II flippase)
MAPMLFALAVFQVNTFLDQVLAEALIEGDGAVSSFNYASRLFQFPLGLVGVALGTAMFPLMSRFAAENQLERLTASLLNSVRLLVFIAVPAAVGLAVLAFPIVELLFGGPRAKPEMLQRCALVVAMLCISLPIVSIISLLTKAFFALRDYKTPTRIALVAVAVNLIANVILLQTPLQEAGLAVGTAISGALNLALLVLVLRGRLKGTIVDSMRLAASPQVSERLAQPLSPSALRSFPISLVRSVVVATAMGCVAYWVERAVFGAFDDHGRSVRALSVIAAIASGVAVYASASWMLRAPEVTQILSLRRRRTTTPPEVS